MNIILPSLLAAPTLTLGATIEELSSLGLHDFHIDMMDYHFTPNFGLSIHHIEEVLAQYPQSVLDVHLMTQPTKRELLKQLIELGIKNISVHWETLSSQDQQWLKTQAINLRIALNPNEAIPPDLASDKVLILCVNPGFSHQSFQSKMLEKIQQAKSKGLNVMVDGGINAENIEQIMAHHPDHLVIGSGLIKSDTSARQALIQKIKDLQG